MMTKTKSNSTLCQLLNQAVVVSILDHPFDYMSNQTYINIPISNSKIFRILHERVIHLKNESSLKKIRLRKKNK